MRTTCYGSTARSYLVKKNDALNLHADPIIGCLNAGNSDRFTLNNINRIKTTNVPSSSYLGVYKVYTGSNITL